MDIQNVKAIPLRKNDVVEVDIVDFGCDGEGVAKIDGFPVFIPFAIEGERVRAKILSVKQSHAFGKLEHVLVRSPDRVKPPCPFYFKCGGCGLQHLAYDKQLQYKATNILSTVKKIAGIDLPPFGVVASEPDLRCRNKLSLPVRKGIVGEIKIGFFRPHSHDVVAIDDCIMQKGGCGELIVSFKRFMKANGLSAYCEREQTGDVRHLSLRVLGGMTTVTVVGTFENPGRIRAFSADLEDLYGAEGYALYYNRNLQKNNVIFGKEFILLSGWDLPVLIDGLYQRVHPAAFFQVNDSVREKLFRYVTEQARDAVTGFDTVAIEAYAGQGLLACRLSPYFEKVIAVESFPESAKAGRETAKANGIFNLSFVISDCETAIGAILKEHPRAVLILDPPRAGLTEPVRKTITESGAETVIYISCNPATLARDLSALKQRYTVTEANAFDMFPQTPIAETVAVMKKTV